MACIRPAGHREQRLLRDGCLCAGAPFVRNGRAQRLGRQPRVPLPVLRHPCGGWRCRGGGGRARGEWRARAGRRWGEAGGGAGGAGRGRAAIDELARLAAAKTPTGSRRLLAERAAAQSGIAEAEALLRSGRGFLLGTIRETWDAVQTGERITTAQKALLRLAATTAALNAAKAVDICYNLGGASSIYESNPLQRHFRDIHTVTQHVMVGQPTLEVAGRIMLGLPTDTSTL